MKRSSGVLMHVSSLWGNYGCGTFGKGALEWVEKTELKNLPLCEGDLVVLKLLDERRDFFALKLEYKNDKLVSNILYN